MSGYYTTFRDRQGQYRFNLKSGNHEIILHSESYTTAQSRDNGIQSVRVHSPIDRNYDRRVATDGSPYFVLKAANGEIIGMSEMYSSTQARDGGIEDVKRIAPTAPVREAASE